MIDYIRIQNFRSITDATFHLQDVNLLVGANNSGKTNFLKALQFLSDLYNQKPIDDSILNNFKDFDGKNEICFTIGFSKNETFLLYKCTFFYINSKLQTLECVGISKKRVTDINLFSPDDINLCFDNYFYNYIIDEPYLRNAINGKNLILKELYSQIDNYRSLFLFVFQENSIKKALLSIQKFNFPLEFLRDIENYNLLNNIYNLIFNSIFSNLKIYKPNLTLIAKESPLSTFEIINEDSSNLVSFIDEIMSNNPKIYDKLNSQISSCVQEFSKVTSPNFKDKVSGKVSGKKLNFISTNGTNFSADTVSDGVLYFLSLLCILNQPNAPKLLILEEPENGIHPVRIQEIINYIFELAESQNIQVILTSHSPVVIDLFSDYPENIFVFNKEKDVTEVKNLKEIIDEYKKDFGDKVDVLNDLSSNWFAGLIGGVPA